MFTSWELCVWATYSNVTGVSRGSTLITDISVGPGACGLLCFLQPVNNKRMNKRIIRIEKEKKFRLERREEKGPKYTIDYPPALSIPRN